MSRTPDRADILNRLRQVVAGRVPVDPASMLPEAKLADIGLDSFSLIELVFLVEEEFNIKIAFEGVVLKTVGDVLDLIAQGVEVSAASY